MKPSILSLAFVSAAVSAQTMPVKRTTSTQDLFSIGVEYASAAKSTTTNAGTFDSSGVTIDLRAAVARGFFLTAAFGDISHKDATLTGSTNDYSLGFGTNAPLGAGSIDLCYAFGKVDFNGTRYSQHTVKAGYTLPLGNGVEVGVALLEFVNDKAISANVTAPEVSVAYKFGQGLAAKLSFSTENTLFGFAGGSSTMAFGMRYGF